VKRPINRARWAGGALIAAIALVFVFDLVGVVRTWDQLRPLGAGGAAPAFELPRIGERGRIGPDRLSLASLRGRTVVIDFWETWCRPCREAMPVLEKVVARHAARVDLVSVCSDGTRRPLEARKLVEELAPHAALLADDGAVADRYGVGTIPHVVVIGPDGDIVSVHRRFSGAASLERALEQAIRDARR
jgi:thiol-disulfide isomerase/thioredoxin